MRFLAESQRDNHISYNYLGTEVALEGALPVLVVPAIYGSVSMRACVLLGCGMPSRSVLQAGDAGSVDTLVAVRRILD